MVGAFEGHFAFFTRPLGSVLMAAHHFIWRYWIMNELPLSHEQHCQTSPHLYEDTGERTCTSVQLGQSMLAYISHQCAWTANNGAGADALTRSTSTLIELACINKYWVPDGHCNERGVSIVWLNYNLPWQAQGAFYNPVCLYCILYNPTARKQI